MCLALLVSTCIGIIYYYNYYYYNYYFFNYYYYYVDLQLCEGVSELLKGHTELLEDFAAFLNPGEAEEVGLLMANIQHRKVTEFLRKLEVSTAALY